jgi:hypothetical protein
LQQEGVGKERARPAKNRYRHGLSSEVVA